MGVCCGGSENKRPITYSHQGRKVEIQELEDEENIQRSYRSSNRAGKREHKHLTNPVIDRGDVEHPEQEGHQFEDHLRAFQKEHADEVEVDLLAEYEEAKHDFCLPVELRKLD